MCDTLVRVEPGRVLFAKNSDRDPNEGQLLDWQPARSHEPGASVRCTWIEIPQVQETRAVLLSRPFWMWGAEIGANDHGVVIGNEAVFTSEPYAATGLTGMDLLRLALERSSSAAAAVTVITDLLEAHGQGGGCGHEHRDFTYHNSFLVADATGAYVIETAGRKWAVEHVQDGARSVSNGLTIPGFADRYADRRADRLGECEARRAITEGGAGAGTTVLDLFSVLRTHGGGAVAPTYAELNGAMSGPCVHAGGSIVGSQTTASWVAELSAAGARHWVTATAAPCTSLFKPVRVGEPLALGPPPADVDDGASLWWRHERLHRTVLRDPARLLPLFAPARDDVEARWVAQPPTPREAFAEADELLEEWTAAVAAAGGSGDTRPEAVQAYWAERARRAA